MRITNTTIARNYTSNLNRNLSRLNYANLQTITSRKFSSMAEDTASGIRAMSVRRSYTQISGYLDNAKSAKNVLSGAEKNLMQISNLTKDINDNYLSAMNGDKTFEDRQVIASDLVQLRDQILATANGQYSDRYIFGGTNTKSLPFTVDDNGDLFYNNVKVADIKGADGQVKSEYKYLFEDASYLDVGLGMAMQGGAASQSVISNTAVKTSFVGLDFLGSGSDNLYLVVNDLIDSLRDPNFDSSKAGDLLKKFEASANDVGIALTKLGSDDNYLDFTISRLETEEYNMTERIQTLEFIDPTEAIMNFKMQEYVYNAALQMGARILQPNIFSFIS